ncbi:MAG: hypothetical protein KAH56_09230 [Candidatus Krumholzibacteria bacterium]|nr:hypothetical protein [Candidatus Krumholzibacteria bacterium]
MAGSQSRTLRRGYVALNLGSLIILEGLYYGWVAGGVHNPVAVGLIVVCMITLVLSFLHVIWGTGLWRLTHTGVENLDERQVMVTREALRHSYGIFVPFTLLVIFAAAVASDFDFHIFDVVLPAGLLYLAHILPAIILAWKEKVV